jgi:hypothetical protein
MTKKTLQTGGENTLPFKTIPSLPRSPSQSYSIEDIISKCMLDKEGTGNKGYFTRDDWIVRLLLLPNEHFTEDQAEQTLQQLLQEGKVVEFEATKYKPTTAEEEEK